MAKTLIIVESPSKIKTIQKIVGNGYTIMASYGHIRDLDDSFNGLGVDVNNGYKPSYATMKMKPGTKGKMKSKTQIIDELKKAAKSCDLVLIASDPDREGEAIAWHLKNVLKHNNVKRIEFNEITPKAVKDALSNQRDINMDLFYAQQARRILDRLVGFTLSPVLWKKIAKGLSVGRVQSPALRMIANKEKEIIDFKPEEYYDLTAYVKTKDSEYTVKLEKIEGKKDRVKTSDEAEEAKRFVDTNWDELGVISITERKAEKKPSSPFTTALLQKAGNTMLGWTAERVMKVAQSLYEEGKITYMRTDSTRLSDDAMRALQTMIKHEYGAKYYKKHVYDNVTSKNNVQGAHEAIRPSDFSVEQVDFDSDANALYKLIWKRAVASQMSNAIVRETNVDITIGRYEFNTKGSVVEFDGFSKVWPIEIDSMLPDISDDIKDNKLDLLDVQQKFTKAPARFSEAKLVGTLEKEGVGRPSTYAAIIEVLLKREYVVREGSGKGAVLKATPLGIQVSDFLGVSFEKYVTTSFTAQMESDLDDIERGKLCWSIMLDKYYPDLKGDAKDIGSQQDEVGRKCPECGEELIRKVGKFGKFVACSGYPVCRYIDKSVKEGDDEIDKDCPECGGKLVQKRSRFGAFYGCSNYPKCKHIDKEASSSVKDSGGVALKSEGKCPECGKDMVKKFSKKTKKNFIGCSDYPNCKYIKPSPKSKKSK